MKPITLLITGAVLAMAFARAAPVCLADDDDGILPPPAPRRPASQPSDREEVALTYRGEPSTSPAAAAPPGAERPPGGGTGIVPYFNREVTGAITGAGGGGTPDPATRPGDAGATAGATQAGDAVLLIWLQGRVERQGPKWVAKIRAGRTRLDLGASLADGDRQALAAEQNQLRDALRNWSVELTREQVEQFKRDRQLRVPVPEPFAELRMWKTSTVSVTLRPPGDATRVTRGTASGGRNSDRP